MKVRKDLLKSLNLFIYKNEYVLLELAGIFCGFLIILIANNFFVTSKIFYLIFFLGLLSGCLGFLIEYYIKNDKRKAVEMEFSYFLYDLSKEYKKTKNLSLALNNLSEHNFYGNLTSDIKRLANRVSWGDSFEEAISAINENINSPVIIHTITLMEVLKKSAISFDKVLENLAKDTQVFKSESRNQNYFSNLFYLSFIFYFIFVFVLLYINHIIGSNFLWFSETQIITRAFFDNFILYITLLLCAFTAYVMYAIKKEKVINFVRYIMILFVITIILFQIFVPKPDAEGVIIDTIEYMKKNNENKIEMNHIIALKTISSKHISDITSSNVYFIESSCIIDCKKYSIFVNEPAFYNFIIERQDVDYAIYYSFN